MSTVIKSGKFIDDVEVTSEHIGKKLEVLKSDEDHWLPVDFITTIKGVHDNGVILLHDTGGADSYYEVDLESNCWKFKWVTPHKPKNPSTKPQRQKLAKAIREAKAALDSAIQEAEEVGMVVDVSKDNIKITFNPPVEEY